MLRTFSDDNVTPVPAEGNICCHNFPARYSLAILGFIAMAINYGLRANINILILSMVNHTAINTGNVTLPVMMWECETDELPTNKDGPFIWSHNIQGMILSAYYWPYMLVQIPGGIIAQKYSAKWAVFTAVLVNIVCTYLIPACAYMHYSALIFNRVCQGFWGACLIPALHVLLSRWAPPKERSFISSLTYTGMAFGTIFAMIFAGYFADNLGWEVICYLMATVCIPWCVFWTWLVQDTPNEQRYITEKERIYILHRLGRQHRHTLKFPWKSVFTSVPFWAILITHLLNNWCWYLFLIEYPLFVTTVLRYSLEDASIISSTPLLLHWAFSIGCGHVMDWLMINKNLSTTAARKISSGVASLVPALCMIINGLVGCHRTVLVTVFTIGIMSMGASLSGFFCNHIDIARFYAGTLMGITNTVATLPAIFVPNLVGYLESTYSLKSAWSIMFYVTLTMLMIEFLTFVILASGEEQEWNYVDFFE